MLRGIALTIMANRFMANGWFVVEAAGRVGAAVHQAGRLYWYTLSTEEPENSGILQKQSDTSYRRQGQTQKRKAEQESTRTQSAITITLFFGFSNGLSISLY